MNEKATERIQVLLTPSEKKALIVSAKELGLSASSFIRMTMLKELKQKKVRK